MAESHGAKYGGGMNKGRKYDISNTNISGLGTDLEKAIKQAAANTEPAWKGAGKKPEIIIWRIEKFQVVKWPHYDPKKQILQLFSGDSYVILHSYHKRRLEGALIWDIHFWIGNQSSQDEYGTAAYKTVELDDYFGGGATQFREVQGHESRRFKSIFKQVIIQEGGIDSGFNKVAPTTYRSRLLHVKGKLNVVCQEVDIKASSINHGDSFIFDAGYTIYIWHGRSAGAMEKSKAANIAQAMDDHRGGKCTRHVLEDGDRDQAFFKALNVRASDVKSAEEGGADSDVQAASKRLLELSDASGKLSMQEIASGNEIRRDLLNSGSVYILDDGYEVMVWVGKGASRGERRTALNAAATYLQQFGRELDTPISKVMEGGENEMFEAAFEVGVSSGSDIESIRAQQRTGAAAASATAGYKGSGGPGVVTDFDAIYMQQGADPDAWNGRIAAQSLYAQELQAAGAGAYSSASGWVSGKTPEERAKYDAKVAELEAAHASGNANPYQHSSSYGGGAGATLRAHDGFSASEDAQTIRKCVKGMGTKDKKLIELLCNRTQVQRLQIKEAYMNDMKRDIMDDLKGDLSGDYQTVVLAMMKTPPERAAYFLHKAVDQYGTDNWLITEILCTREGWEVQDIKEAYTFVYSNASMEEDLKNDLSGDFQNLMVAIAAGGRELSINENPDPEKAKEDARILWKAGEARFGTNDARFIELLSQRSYPEIKMIAEFYPEVSKKGKTLIEAIEKETSGSYKKAMRCIVAYSLNPTEFYVDRLHAAMSGLGTRDYSLMNIIIERSEVDMGEIKERYKAKYGKTLKDAITGDTSGYYRTLLLKLIGE